MQLLIDTKGVQFQVRRAPQPRQDFRDKEKQATTRDGQLIWSVGLDATDTVRETKETIWVEVAGDMPKVTFDGLVSVRGLVYAPWVGKDGKIKRSFRAEAIEPAVSSGKSVQAA